MSLYIRAFPSDLLPESSALDPNTCTTLWIEAQREHVLSVKTALVLIFSYQIANFCFKGRVLKWNSTSEIGQFHLGIGGPYTF